MAKVTIDGIVVEVANGSTILQAAETHRLLRLSGRRWHDRPYR
jgi:hypothetical protein